MHILKAVYLWLLISVHVVGAAFLFRRLFPRESRWLAFFVPGLIMVMLCNFLEHSIPLTHLRLLLPLTATASVAAVIRPKSPWRCLKFPTLLFLSAFAFTFGLRFIRPDIVDARDGVPDIAVVANFLYGQTLPAESIWLPPLKMLHYYCLEHYGASLLTRFFGIDIGTGFNLSVALLSAYLLFLPAAIAWHLSRGKIWIVLLMMLVTACAATGATGYLWLTVKNLDPENVTNPYSLLDSKATAGNWLALQLTPVDLYDRHLLLPPGYGIWNGCLHSVQTGQVLLAFIILALIEMSRRRRTDWPWISFLVSPFFMLTTCTWGMPFVFFMMISGLFICWRLQLTPHRLSFTLIVTTAWVILFEPMLAYFLESPPFGVGEFDWATGLHTQIPELVAQWWLIFVPAALLLFIWRKLHPATLAVLAMTPLAFAAVDIWNYGGRLDTTGKMWGLTFAAAWFTFFPELARRRFWPFRAVLLLITLASALSLCFWTTYYWRVVPREDIGHIDGHGQLRDDRRKARILEVISRLNNETIISGKSDWAFSESALLPILTHNRTYVAWNFFTDVVLYPNGIKEAWRRTNEVNNILEGKDAAPLYFLRQRNIAALVIYPDDNIDPEVVDHLRKVLAPYYSFDEANLRSDAQMNADAYSASPARPCAGVFLYRPEITTLLGQPKANSN